MGIIIKKESPNEGTETLVIVTRLTPVLTLIKKESPNEGTETQQFPLDVGECQADDKKRIPE